MPPMNGAMRVTIREMRREDARNFLDVHHAAVRGLAARDYPPAVIEAWAPAITDERIERFLANRDGELRLVAEIGGEIVGIGALVARASELRACYVAPAAARRGVGTAIVKKSSGSLAAMASTVSRFNRRLRRSRSIQRLAMRSSVAASSRSHRSSEWQP